MRVLSSSFFVVFSLVVIVVDGRASLKDNTFRPRREHYAYESGLVSSPMVPNWAVTWQMNQSTTFMPCNYSGLFSPSFSAQFGIADYDWSNGKEIWANQQPMDCEELLVTQAQLTKEQNPNMKVSSFSLNFLSCSSFLLYLD